jgi:radical SAM superfamily enzyme YgiQ (UPF0313 family)
MLSSVLKREGHEARILLMHCGCAHYTATQLHGLEYLIQGSVLVGVSCHSLGCDRAQQVLRYLKKAGIPTVWGGIHATLNAVECADVADMVCIGEGEGAIVDLVRRLEQNLDWHNILNIAYNNNGSFIRNPLRPLAEMDTLPVLDFSCLEEFELKHQGFERRLHCHDLVTEEIPFLASRGCAFHCTYCCNAKLREMYTGKGHYVRKHSVAGFVERAATLRKQYFPQGKRLFFVDDDFLDRSMDELEEFSRTYPARVGLPFECQVAPARVNEDRIDLLAKAGVWRIRMGVESGSERTKKQIYRRSMPNESVMIASKTLARYPNIVRAYYFIMGNPFEEREDLVETIRLILRLPPPYFVQVFNLVFFPGSVLYEQALAKGMISGKPDSGYDLHYRGGLQYREHSCKLRNLYLNMLLYMMEGKVTPFRLGLLPRFLVPFLIYPGFITTNEHTLALAKSMIGFKTAMLQVRSAISCALQRILPNKELLYNPGLFFAAKLQRYFGGAPSN